MALLKWNDSLSVNIAAIDKQHKKLIDIVNELNDAMRQGRGNDVVGEIVDRLVSYAGEHFRTEESSLNLHKYPDTEAHKASHKKFKEQILEFQEKFAAGNLGLTVSVMRFLSNWLQDHIKGEDQKYSSYLNSKGVY